MALVNKLTAIGDAIRSKNGSTDKLTLDAMVTAINDMASVTIDGVKVKDKLALTKLSKDVQKSNLPYDHSHGDAIVVNNELHILGGGYNYSQRTNHYKWNGTTWTSVSTLPCRIYDPKKCVLFNDEIHMISDDDYITHYKWNGSSWTQVSTLPTKMMSFSLVSYNGAIHHLGCSTDGTYRKTHYKFNGTSWVKLSNPPIAFYNAVALNYKNNIHVLQGEDHYKWNGSSWTKVSTIPYTFQSADAIVYDDKIHILGGYGDYGLNHYIWDGSSWTSDKSLPFSGYYSSAVVYGGKINLIGGDYNNSTHLKHYILKGYTYYEEV